MDKVSPDSNGVFGFGFRGGIELFFRWLFFSLVLFGVPAAIAWRGFEEIGLERKAGGLLERERKLDTALSTIERWKEPKIFFEMLMDRLREKVFSKKREGIATTFKRYSVFLKRRFPETLEFIFLDSGGNAIPELCDRVAPRKLLKKFFADLLESQSEGDNSLRKNWNLYRAFLGNLIEEPNYRLFRRLTDANNSARHAFVYVANSSSIQKTGMFIVHFDLHQQWEQMVARYCIGLFESINRAKNIRIFLFDEKVPDALGIGSRRLKVSESDLLTAFVTATRSNQEFFVLNGNLWGSRLLHPGLRLFAVSTGSDKSIEGNFIHVCRAGVLLVFLCLSVLTFRLIVSDWNPYFSIKFKMLLLFLYTAGIPMIIMLITANRYLTERRQFLERKILFDQERALTIFDEKFPRIFGILEPLIGKEVEGPFPDETVMLDEVKERLKKIDRNYQPGLIRLVNAQGKTVFSSGSSEDSKPMLEKLLKEISRDVFRNINFDDQPEPGPATSQITDAAADLFGFSSRRIFGDLARNRGKLKEFTFASFHQTMGVFATLNTAGKACYLTLIGWEKRFLEERYISQYLSEANRGVSDLLQFSRFYCVHRADPKKNVPADYPYRKMIQFSIQKLFSQGKTVFDRIERPTRVFLTTGLHGKNLKEYDLVASTPDEPVQGILHDLRVSILGICSGVTAISFALGLLLSRKFLKPVEHLSFGIEALRRRNFSTRIPVLEKDELGDLSHVFNDMMEGMKDLEVARLLQENFFPKGPLTVGTVSIFGTCRTAARVGGDYFDYFPLGVGKMAVVIGDVAGHGVPAALVVAMAKVLIADHSSEIGNPSAVMTLLNRNLLSILQRKRIMSCFIMILDTVQKNILFTNAGHVYPLLVRNGAPKELRFTKYPLGLKVSTDFQNVAVPLESSDRLFLFTDGLVEALDKRGESIGYARLQAVLPRLLKETPEESEKAVRSWFADLSPRDPPEDDVTIVVINVGTL